MRWIGLGVVLMLSMTVALVAYRSRWRTIRRYIDDVATCGFLPPPPSPRATRAQWWLARCFAFVQVGRIDVVGREHLAAATPPYIVTPNHPHYADAAVVPLVLDAPSRYFVARGVLHRCFGVGALVLGPMGAVCVDLSPGKGSPAVAAGIQLLVAGERLVLFPEGWAHMDGVPGPYKTGAVRITKAAAAALGRPTYLIPVFLRYARYPGPWIRRLPPAAEYLIVLFGFWRYRRGVRVVIGVPIASSELPGDDHEATAMLRQRIEALDPEFDRAVR
jgi:1-acyl-sn-glycerol-3-phosphate acyltransferase